MVASVDIFVARAVKGDRYQSGHDERTGLPLHYKVLLPIESYEIVFVIQISGTL
jgi:hypothetical protein